MENIMFNSKQRSNLRGIASTIDPIAQLGKASVNEDDGTFTENFLNMLDEALEARELIKITVLKKRRVYRRGSCRRPCKGFARRMCCYHRP